MGGIPMRTTEFIIEDFATEQTLLNAAGTIKQNCQPYLKLNKDAMISRSLYRGVKPPGGFSVTGAGDANFIRKDIRLTDRRPSDMDEDIYEFFNKYFTEMYGAPFRNAMFASGSSGDAADYGAVYVIFPIGEFQYLWSDTIEDLYTELHKLYDEHPIDGYDILQKQEALALGSELHNDLYDYVTSYQTDELEKAILSSHEIMIRAQSYYGIHIDVQYNLELTNKLNEILYG